MAVTNASHISASRVEAEGDELRHTEAATPPGTPPAIDHLPEPPTPDANHPTTGTGPLPSGAGPVLANGVQVPQVTERPSFVRHCPSSTNRDAYKQKTGRQLAPLLIDESGMGARFHLLDNEIFSAHISGAAPSDADRKKFKTPTLKKGMLERDIYLQLGAVVKSVLDAAKCTKLRFLDTAAWFPDEPFPEPPTPPSTAPTVRRFIVGRPHFSAEALVGRCTRGYMAFDVTDPKKWVPCFLKDSWRPFVPHRTRPEHLVYERFKRRKVTERIATMICGGDVGGFRAQRTEVQNDLPDTNKPVLRIHYRLVTKEIGLPLWEFDNFSELSAIFVDALRGHRKAWDLAGVLHRDISVGNIMILTHEDRTRSGFLIDWDLSRLQCELGKGPVEPDRTGTWQFRSALSLRYPRKPYRRSDDIESFIHAYIYLVLRYHTTDVDSLKLEIETVFEGASRVGGIKIGGTHKIKMLRRGDLGFEIVGNIYLQQLLNDILLHCKTTYENINYLEMARLYGPVQGAAQPGPPAQHASGPQNASRVRPKRLMRHASDDERPSASLDHVHSHPEKQRQREDAQPGAPKEPCAIGLFLADPTTLIKRLVQHSEDADGYWDKAPDQFTARQDEDVFRPPEKHGLRSIGALSVTGSFPSEEAVEEAPAALPSRAEVSPANSAASFDQGTHSYDLPPATPRTKRTRAYEEDEDIVDDEGESSDWPRRSKRLKSRKGKGASRAR
ncbi:hypothetical protein GSI_12408 [Ganoderma sinense ZZ0214-1]|uniref:Fungal-type protein kinase domain-containing protein n=1 Tax=Ganoderma sinense ZZ0214-1 TaxID=1077348 RepID=A0A2G8RVH9_9APHY|nr:hypothetical protein GSI_12408 [Ganoderma sinense ZZ0214-1]